MSVDYNYYTKENCYVLGPMEKLLNNRCMVILGRLSYAVYLVNITVIMIIESKQRAVLYLSADVMVSICTKCNYCSEPSSG